MYLLTQKRHSLQYSDSEEPTPQIAYDATDLHYILYKLNLENKVASFWKKHEIQFPNFVTRYN